MEKWVKAPCSESERSWLRPRWSDLLVILGSNKCQTLISYVVPRYWSKVSCGAVNSLVIRFAWEDLAVERNFVFYLITVAILIGFGRACRLGGGGILKLSNAGKPQRDGTIFMEEFDPSRHHVKILFGNCRRARLDEMVKKWGREMFIFHGIIPAALHLFWSKFYRLS